MKFRIQNEELRIVSREMDGDFAPLNLRKPSPLNRPLYIPFRLQLVILSVSEESPNFKANPSSTCGDSSSQAPQNDKEKRRRTDFGLNEEPYSRSTSH